MDICSTIEDDSDNFEEWLTPERKQVLNDGYWAIQNLYPKEVSLITLLQQ